MIDIDELQSTVARVQTAQSEASRLASAAEQERVVEFRERAVAKAKKEIPDILRAAAAAGNRSVSVYNEGYDTRTKNEWQWQVANVIADWLKKEEPRLQVSIEKHEGFHDGDIGWMDGHQYVVVKF